MIHVSIVFLLLFSNALVYKVCHASSYSRLISGGVDHHRHSPINKQPLAKIAIHKTVIALHESASIRYNLNPLLLGIKVKTRFLLVNLNNYSNSMTSISKYYDRWRMLNGLT